MILTSPVRCVSETFIFMVFLDYGFSVFAVIRRIRFALASIFDALAVI